MHLHWVLFYCLDLPTEDLLPLDIYSYMRLHKNMYFFLVRYIYSSHVPYINGCILHEQPD